MEKKLKKVQRGAAVGFVLLKILRILLIVAAVLLIISLVALAVVNENNLPIEGVKDGKLALDLQQLDLSALGIDKVLHISGLVPDDVLNVDLRDAKLAVLMLLGVGILALAATYVPMLVAGTLFKHMKKEETPFTQGNVRRLRLLGVLHLIIWIGGVVLSYFVGFELIRRLALPSNSVNISMNLSALLIVLIYFFLARVFSFGKAQGEAIPAAQPVIVPEPVAEPAPVVESEPVYQPAPAVEPEPVYAPAEPAVEPAPAMEPEPLPENVPAEETPEV